MGDEYVMFCVVLSYHATPLCGSFTDIGAPGRSEYTISIMPGKEMESSSVGVICNFDPLECRPRDVHPCDEFMYFLGILQSIPILEHQTV